MGLRSGNLLARPKPSPIPYRLLPPSPHSDFPLRCRCNATPSPTHAHRKKKLHGNRPVANREERSSYDANSGMSQTGDQEPSPAESASSSVNWKDRVFLPTLLAGVAGGGYGLVSKHRKVHGVANISATYATNFAIVTACYCGAREFVRVSRKSDPDDLLNSALGGFGSGALLGRLQGGQVGAIKYSILFAVVGTAVDYTVMKVRPILTNGDWFKLPEWSPIKVLDEEELASKQAQEDKLFAQRALGKLNKEES